MGKVTLLTGAPGTGKSTLRRSLEPCIAGLQHFDYGELLLRRKERQGSILSYSELREQSSSVISPTDVLDTDEWVSGLSLCLTTRDENGTSIRRESIFASAKDGPMSGVNYSFRSTTTIIPDSCWNFLPLLLAEMALLLAGPERSPEGAERRACQQQRRPVSTARQLAPALSGAESRFFLASSIR